MLLSLVEKKKSHDTGKRKKKENERRGEKKEEERKEITFGLDFYVLSPLPGLFMYSLHE